MEIYGLKNCDTCKKARKALPMAEFLDVREDGIAIEILETAYATFQEALINTRSTTWRSLDTTQRASDPIELLKEHPPLMKRPLIRDGEKLYLGWTKETQETLIK